MSIRRVSQSDQDEDEDVSMNLGLTPLEAAKRAGNINIAEEDDQVMDLPETLAESLREQQDKVRQLRLARKARAVVVPTNDLKVRRRLRELGEPITLFGENIPGRRERLRAVLSKLILEGHTEATRIQEEEVRREEEEQTGGPVRDKAYLMPGQPELAAARLWIAERSVVRSQARLRAERQEVEEWQRAAYAHHRVNHRRLFSSGRHLDLEDRARQGQDEGRMEDRDVAGDGNGNGDEQDSQGDGREFPLGVQKEAVEAYRLHRYRQLKRRVQGFFNSASEIADVRPVSSVDWSPDGRQLVTGSWSGQCKVWDAFNLRQLCRLQEQPERVTDVAWHARSPHIATGCVDGVARIFRIGEYEAPVIVKPEPSSSSSSSSTAMIDDDEANPDAIVRLGIPFKSIAERYRSGGNNNSSNSSGDGGDGAAKWCLSTPGAAEAVMGSERSRQARYPVVGACLELRGHEDRLSQIAWHPSGRFLGTASYDLTWRLWDLERGVNACVLKQPGHIRPVYSLSFQRDGALAFTGDLGGAGYLWDLRTGRTVMPMEGHAKQVVCSDFHPNGWLLATGSDDNTARIWDLRRRQCMYVVPAHTKMLSSVQWQPGSGHLAEGCFLTASFDGSVKLWSQVDCSNLATLVSGAGQGSRVMGAKWAPDAESIASCTFDRTFKLWTPGFDDENM